MRGLAVGAILAGLAALPVWAQSLDERLPTCFACHGENGTSQLPETPSLGAQQAFYSMVQLLMFREKMRVTEPMNEMAKGLTDDELRKAGETIAKLPPPTPDPGTPDPVRMEKARALEPTAPLQFLSPGELSGPGERSTHRRPARGLPAQGVARLQGQLPARLRRADGGSGLHHEG